MASRHAFIRHADASLKLPSLRTVPRTVYSLAWWLAMPLVLARLWWRGRREPGYRRHWGERFGCYAGMATGVDDSAVADTRPVLWVHAVSVGETRAAAPLIEALLAAYPSHRILLTHMTPTGRATGAALIAATARSEDAGHAGHAGHTGHAVAPMIAPRIVQRYLPYDTILFVTRLLKHYRPAICLLIETEVWPNLVACCQAAGVPVALVNARLSERSLARGERLRSLLAPAAAGLAWTGAQTDADAMRLRSLGAAPVEVTGSLKFDVVPPPVQLARGEAWRRRFGRRPVLLLASTREGEEALILAALKSMPLPPRVMLILAPRHPQRFDAVADLVAKHGFILQRRSLLADTDTDMPLPGANQILLADSMGELFTWYAVADLAFIGGSLMPLGGQNLIEACAAGTPVLIGPSSFNFAGVTRDAIDAGAAVQVEDAASMLSTARLLLDDAALRGAMAGAARQFAARHRGATARTLAGLRPLLDAPSGMQDRGKPSGM